MNNSTEKRLLLHLNEGPLSREPWSISEIDQYSANTANNQIPWYGQFEFDLTDLRLVTRIGIPDPYERHKEGLLGEDACKIRERSAIKSSLKPHKYHTNQFSMFGTSQPIEYFDIAIFPKLNTSEGHLELCGSPDSCCISLNLFISVPIFRKLAFKIERNSLSGARIFMTNVTGIYSDVDRNDNYGENIRHFKMLSRDTKKQQIEMPINTDIDPPRMGVISDFELQVYSNLIYKQNIIQEKNVDDQ